MRFSLEAPRPGVLCTRRAARALVLALAVTGAAACGDDPFQVNWDPVPDTVLLYSLGRPELNLPEGFSFHAVRGLPPLGQTVVVEAPGNTGLWDVALDTRADGSLQWVLPGTFDIPSRARITSLGSGLTLEEVEEAPRDTAAYVSKDPVPVTVGEVYVVQTDTRAGTFGSCVYYAKMEPIAVDPVAETATFVYVTSPVCNDRRLIPPD